MDQRIGVVGIVIEDRECIAPEVNRILSQFGDVIVGRIGVPRPDHDLAVIALIVQGTADQMGALTGRLGNLPSVQVKSGMTSKRVKTDGEGCR